MSAEEKTFACVLHGQDVRVICHDAFNMAQLQGDIGRIYGISLPLKW